jgi:hypothetical protein
MAEINVSDIVERYLAGKSCHRIAKELGANSGTVWKILKSQGIILRSRRKFTAAELAARRREQYRRHRQTDKGKATALRSAIKYARSPKGKSTRKAWSVTPSGMAALRNSALKYRYGITLDQWNILFEGQSRACAVCGATDPGCKQGWHTHHTESAKGIWVHGILCKECNRDARDGSAERVAYLRKLADWIEAGLYNVAGVDIGDRWISGDESS